MARGEKNGVLKWVQYVTWKFSFRLGKGALYYFFLLLVKDDNTFECAILWFKWLYISVYISV